MRTKRSQSERKRQGTLVEKIVKKDLMNHDFPKTTIRQSKGVDIIANNGGRMSVEVKSSLEKEKSDTNGTQKLRTGRYTLKKSDCENCDLFAFVTKKTKDGKWLKPDVKIRYVKSKYVKDWLKKKGTYKTGKSTKISIKAIQSFPKAKLH